MEKVKTAREMFKELDYDWQETETYIQYTKYHWKHWLFKSKTTICFWKLFKKVSIYNEISLDIDLDTLQAINKQVEEFGWLGDKE